LGSINLQKLIN